MLFDIDKDEQNVYNVHQEKKIEIEREKQELWNLKLPKFCSVMSAVQQSKKYSLFACCVSKNHCSTLFNFVTSEKCQGFFEFYVEVFVLHFWLKKSKLSCFISSEFNVNKWYCEIRQILLFISIPKRIFSHQISNILQQKLYSIKKWRNNSRIITNSKEYKQRWLTQQWLMLQYISQKKTQFNRNINRAHSNEKSNEKKCLSSFSNWSSLIMTKPLAMDSKPKKKTRWTNRFL